MPPDAQSLAERLQRDYERFSPAQQALARYLSDHLADVPLLSAHEIARASHCSPATVVRFAQSLGYAGYPEMQAVVRRAQRPRLPVAAGPSSEATETASDLLADRATLDAAAARLGRPGLAPLIAALADRSPIVLAGEGHAVPVVLLLQERLARLGRPAQVVTALDPVGRVVLESLPVGGAVIAVAVGRETRVAEAAVAAARGVGVPAPTLVDSALSPLARGGLARVVPADPGEDGPNIIAMVAVAQAIARSLAAARSAPPVAAMSA
jgi:DNA-binding MurR/RpiR family transcriptional regulator